MLQTFLCFNCNFQLVCKCVAVFSHFAQGHSEGAALAAERTALRWHLWRAEIWSRLTDVWRVYIYWCTYSWLYKLISVQRMVHSIVRRIELLHFNKSVTVDCYEDSIILRTSPASYYAICSPPPAITVFWTTEWARNISQQTEVWKLVCPPIGASVLTAITRC